MADEAEILLLLLNAFAALQMPDTFLPTIFLSRLHLFLRLVNVHLPVLTQKVFICNLEII